MTIEDAIKLRNHIYRDITQYDTGREPGFGVTERLLAEILVVLTEIRDALGGRTQ